MSDLRNIILTEQKLIERSKILHVTTFMFFRLFVKSKKVTFLRFFCFFSEHCPRNIATVNMSDLT